MFRHKSIAAIAIVLASALTGCSNTKVASDGNFTAAINDYLSSDARRLCFPSPSFPAQYPNADVGIPDYAPAVLAQLQDMVQAGLVSETQSQQPALNPSQTISVASFDLTPLGKAHYSTNPNPDMTPGISGHHFLAGQFCFAQLKVGKIVNFTEPNNGTSITTSNVTWTPAIASIDPWAQQLLAAKKLVAAQILLDQVSNAPVFSATMDLTDKGWTVEQLTQVAATSNSSGNGQASSPTSPTTTTPPPGAASPAASASPPTTALAPGAASPAISVSGQPATQATLPPPASSEVRPFSQAAAIAAFAALPGSVPTQADGVTFALWSAKDPAAVDVIAKDFADDFAAHRNADRYVQLLKSRATPMGLSSRDLLVYFGPYDFNSKSFPIVRHWVVAGYDDYNNKLNKLLGRYLGSVSQMPDGSALYIGNPPDLSFENYTRFPTSYALDPDQAEARQKAVQQYSLTEHVTFYPLTISRRPQIHAIDAVVHVTKVVLEQRPSGAPTAVPTILMSTDLH